MYRNPFRKFQFIYLIMKKSYCFSITPIERRLLDYLNILLANIKPPTLEKWTTHITFPITILIKTLPIIYPVFYFLGKTRNYSCYIIFIRFRNKCRISIRLVHWKFRVIGNNLKISDGQLFYSQRSPIPWAPSRNKNCNVIFFLNFFSEFQKAVTPSVFKISIQTTNKIERIFYAVSILVSKKFHYNAYFSSYEPKIKK